MLSHFPTSTLAKTMTIKNTVPALGPKIPRRGNAFSAWLGKTVLRALGWRVVGEVPNLPKLVCIGAPHTSNWDGLVAMAAIFALRLEIHVMMKSNLFKPMLAPFFRWLGGIPIDRSKNAGVVEQSLAAMHSQDQFYLGLSPEGTRKCAEKWRSGFYNIALAANVPILVVALDYQLKEIQIAEVFHPTGEYQTDLAHILQHYQTVVAKKPQNMSLPLQQLQQTLRNSKENEERL